MICWQGLLCTCLIDRLHYIINEPICWQGLLRTCLIERLHYIIDKRRPSPTVVVQVVEILTRVARHSLQSAFKVSHELSLHFCRVSTHSTSYFRYPAYEQGAPWSWKVMEFRKAIFQAWKVMENSKGHGKVLENDDNVMEFLLLHWAVL